MKIQPLSIPDVSLIQNPVFKDDRGFFNETFKFNEALEFGLANFVQENHSHSLQNVVRGLHFQNYPRPTAKLVRCISGEIFDVAVDIRPYSSTYKKWIGVYLDGFSGRSLYIPGGFAHGFCVITQTADVVYKVSEYYDPQHDQSIRWDDPDLNIEWPISKDKVKISDKDKQAPYLKDIQ